MEQLTSISFNISLPDLKQPRINQPIQLEPATPLFSPNPPPQDILDIIGITQSKQISARSTILTTSNQSSQWKWPNLLSSCSACHAASSIDNLNQIGAPEQIIIKDQENINPINKKTEYKLIFMENIRGIDDRKKTKIFEEMYQRYGSYSKQKWKQAIKKQNKNS